MKTIVILQSNYIPWKGYFDLIHDADEFILFDTMQYTRRDWRNRNLIKTPQGPQWLSIPVEVKGKYLQRINETEISDKDWAEKHWRTLKNNYSKAACYYEVAPRLESLYQELATERFLSKVNRKMLEELSSMLKIKPWFSWSSDYPEFVGKTERLVSLCVASGGNRYISGPSARAYIDPALFSQASIELHFKEYSNYPVYPQLHGEFVHGVSILDLLFSTGARAWWYVWGWRQVAENS